MKCLALIGYMCVGKTTIGKALAQHLGMRFYDLDWYIELRFRRKIADIFAQEGEAKFRDMEQRMLHEVAAFEDIVLSCGGGTPTWGDNMEFLNANTETIFLKATPETILAHLQMARGNRPLLAGKSQEELEQYVRAQLAERERHYEQAAHTIDISILDTHRKINDVVERIAAQLPLTAE